MSQTVFYTKKCTLFIETAGRIQRNKAEKPKKVKIRVSEYFFFKN